MSLVKFCPKCKDPRSPVEIVCGGLFDGRSCGYPLYDIVPTFSIPPEEVACTAVSAQPSPETCANGHPMVEGEFMCGTCGATVSSVAEDVDTTFEVSGWTINSSPIRETGESQHFRVSRHHAGTTETAQLKYYRHGVEPQTALYPALSTIDPEHSTRLIDHGRDEGRAFEIWEHLPLGSFHDLSDEQKRNQAFLRKSLHELGSALYELHEKHVIHRDLRPSNILIRALDPLDLVISDFSTAAVSELDLQPGATRSHSRYAAPETIAGAFSPASDWWSLGVIILESLTEGRIFENVCDQAFLLHLVTRGLRVPDELPEEWRELLMGLLTRDHARRWNGDQVARWLKGERGIAHGYFETSPDERPSGHTIRLAGRNWPSPESFALTAAEAENWDEARALFLNGRLATWLQERDGDCDAARAAQARTFATDISISEDARFSLCLLALNNSLPLCLRGEIVSPAWIVAYPETALEWLDSSLPGQLRRLAREAWFVRLRERADRVRSRIRDSGSGLNFDPATLSAAMLVTSRPILEKRWHERRKNFPEARNPLLNSAIARRTQTDEDLIVLVAAPIASFSPAEEVIDETLREASEASVDVDRNSLAIHFSRSRRATFDALDHRLRNFVRCGNETPDRWADLFRQERRISLPRALVLLAIPVAKWIEPPKQEYVRNILNFFHRRIIGGLQRGALVRMTIARTSARLDLTELGGSLRSADELAAAFLSKNESPVAIDPDVLINSPELENRIRRLVQNTQTYQRDTGIEALYLGFPFLVIGASGSTSPRIAPLLLWPAKIESSHGARASVKLAFDHSRGEIRVNPALDNLLGDSSEKWREALDDLRGRERTDIQAVLDTLRPITESPQSKITALPPVSHRASPGSLNLHLSAVLFHCDFSGQTIAEDLAALSSRAIEGTALAALIRSDEVPLPNVPETVPPEHDRYFTAASDPSQESAVFRARNPPGLVVQGPPGTGKSQTIVNIVSDAVGRGERVLIVCQKPAALEVVRKRLEAEGLGRRLLFLRDTTSDRKPTLAAIRDQLERPTRSVECDSRLAREREGIATHISMLESALDEAHHALHEPTLGRPSYRIILDRLLSLEGEASPPIPLPRLRVPLGKLDEPELELLISRIAALAPLWSRARFEDSPLDVIAQFETDDSVREDFLKSILAFHQAETERNQLLAAPHRFRDFASVEDVERWLERHETALRLFPASTLGPLVKWRHVFKPEPERQTLPAADLTNWITSVETDLKSLPSPDAFYVWLADQPPETLLGLKKNAARIAVEPQSFFARIHPGRWLARRRLAAALRNSLEDPHTIKAEEVRQTVALEISMRDAKSQFKTWREALGETTAHRGSPLPTLREEMRDLRQRLADPLVAAERLRTCPSPEISDELRKLSDPADWKRTLDDCRATVNRWHTTRRCEACLTNASIWLTPDLITGRTLTYSRHEPTDDKLTKILEARDTLAAFQDFRLRTRELPQEIMEIFSLLRGGEDEWRSMDDPQIAREVSRTLRHQAHLRWKHLAEEKSPSLLIERDEIDDRIYSLKEQSILMRTANRRLLSEYPSSAAIAPRRNWDEITMFTGPRARRLREVVERGENLGIYHLRPIWLVNPEMVCRVFPLKKDLFDLVIFDEASQLPVEAALPTLFRARRVVVSGDDKQMPPSRFFGASVVDDDDSNGEPDHEETEEEAAERIAQAAERREIKDCTDLLTLSRTVLPTATLEIHYRSKYRHLIEFSNHAFYAGRLHIPARHPDSEVRRALPLVVDRVDTEYSNQTNPGEADQVVRRLAEIWQLPQSDRPTCGVVTFNLKQTELILEKIESRAEEDEDFLQVWREEMSRTDHGEDMSFFVKNLENVQGDERDWIIFSTTFGRDSSGTFRRNFGVLGQQGGERRLNVAVTRAREKILLITSIPTDSVSNWLSTNATRSPLIPRDHLQAWLAYAERLSRGDIPSANQLIRSLLDFDPDLGEFSGSGQSTLLFVREVGEAIQGMGYESLPADGDAFGFDHAIIDPRTGLFGIGIECDAPHHPLLTTARAREIWRPDVIARSIPSVHRVTSKEWYANSKAETARLKKAITRALT